MQVQVILEPVKGNGYKATGQQPFPVTDRGATREEALTKLKKKIQSRMKNGTEVVNLTLDSLSHPLEEFAGMFKGDADFGEVLAIIQENRERMYKDPEVP